MEFRDLKKQYQVLKSEIDKKVSGVLESGQFIGGGEVDLLERRLTEYVGIKNCISCANGTDALSLVLMAWNIGEGDAVFIPDFTFFATAEVVSFNGATPVFVDVDKKTFNLDPQKLEEAICKVVEEGKLKARVVMPVDLFGLPADYKAITEIARKYDLLVLEDGAQGFGGSLEGSKACSFGDAATTSFFPAKPLGCYGDGGAIFTNDDELAELIRSYKVHGKGHDKYDNVRIGVNSRLDSVQAAILNVKLTAFIDYELEAVNKVAARYDKNLAGLVETPYIPAGYISSYAQYTLILESPEERSKLQQYLKDNKIPTMIYYPKTMHAQEAFKNLERITNDLSVSDYLCERVLSLPMHPYLEDEQIALVCSKIREFYR